MLCMYYTIISILILVVLYSRKRRYKWDDAKREFHIRYAEMYVYKNMNISSSFALNRVLFPDKDSSYMDKYAKIWIYFIDVVKSP